ncbi:hypothetical protein NBRC116587_12230 [Pseudoteredinibacter isoporae]
MPQDLPLTDKALRFIVYNGLRRPVSGLAVYTVSPLRGQRWNCHSYGSPDFPFNLPKLERLAGTCAGGAPYSGAL